MFRGCFVVECVYFAECSLGYFVGVGWVFTECSQRVRYLYVTYLPCKSEVFAVQKCGFCFLNVMLLQIGRNVFRG